MGSKRADNKGSKRKRKKHGFRARRETPGGKNVLKRRRTKGRKKLAVDVPKFKGR